MASCMTSKVYVYVYDMTKGLAKSISPLLLGKQLAGIWHTGIVAFDQEYFFGSEGIDSCPPGGTMLGKPDKIIDLGSTEIPFSLFLEYLCSLGESTFRPGVYDLFHHNCNNFSQEVAVFLTGNSIPQDILDLPHEVLDTPLGNSIKKYMDNINLRRPSGIQMDNMYTDSSIVADSDQLPAHLLTDLNIDTQIPNSAIKFNNVDMVEVIKQLNDLLPPVENADKELLKNLGNYSHDNEETHIFEAEHVEVLGSLLNRENASSAIQKLTLQILQLFSLSKNFILLLLQDKSNFIMKYCLQMKDLEYDLQQEIPKLLCNFCFHQSGFSWLVSEDEWKFNDKLKSNCDVTIRVTVDCLLNEQVELKNTGAAVLYNLSLNKKLGNDAITELSTAVLELIHEDLTEETAFRCLSAFSNFLSSAVGDDVTSLARVLGCNFQKFDSLSERNRSIVKCIEDKLLTTEL